MAKIKLEKILIPIEVGQKKSIAKLLEDMSQAGFQGRKLAESFDVLKKMITDKNTTILLGYGESLSTIGQWKIISWFIEKGFVDLIVSTGANISADIIEAMGFNYYQGSHFVDNQELFHQGLNRYYDIYGKESDYLKMTELIADFILTLHQNYRYSSREFLFQFGEWLNEKGINSIIATAAKHNIPIFCPAIVDSPYGDAAVIAKSKGFNLTIDGVKDYLEFTALGKKNKQTGVFYIGEGVPKDFIQPYYLHKYAVQITTDSPQWGGLSGCTFEEAVTRGKKIFEGNFVQCYCDATIALPIIAQALGEKIKKKRKNNLGNDKFTFLI